MNRLEESDRPVVSRKRPNKAGRPAAEAVERRGLVKGNSPQRDMHRMQGRGRVRQALERIRQAAEREKGGKLTSLLHHIYSVDTLREAYYRLEREAAPGVDGVTWRQYGEDLETKLQDLSGRLARGAYRASPVQRVYVPKPDGRQRPIGVPVLEDKIVQRATVAVLNQVYEVDFLDFSYGSRPGRSPHDAIDALDKAIWNQKVNWVLDADVRSFFDAMVHDWAVTFVEHRIGDKRVLRLLRNWLTAGVLEDGAWTQVDEGTPQGGNLTPPTMLQNIGRGATHKRVGWHAEHNVHLLMIDLHAADECTNDLTPGRPVGRFQAGAHARGEIFQASNHQPQLAQ